MATARQGNRRREGQTYWSKRIDGRVFNINGHIFFAPSELQRIVSELLDPKMICKRAGLPTFRWGSWERKFKHSQPWVLDYLVRLAKKTVPDGCMVYQLSQTVGRKREPRANELFTTEEQEKFRAQATIEAAVEDARLLAKRNALPKWCSKATLEQLKTEETKPLTQKIVYCLKVMEDFDWYRPWQLANRWPPEKVTILTATVVANLQIVLDVRPTLKALNSQIGTWDKWRDTFPKDAVPELIHYALGGPEPDGWLVIGPAVDRLFAEGRLSAILDAAEGDLSTYNSWKADPKKAQALQAAIEDECKSGPSTLEKDLRWRYYADAVDVVYNAGRRQTTIASRAKTLDAMRQGTGGMAQRAPSTKCMTRES